MMTEQDSPQHPSGAATTEMVSAPDHTLIDVLTQLALRKWLIAKVTGISIVIGLILCFVLPVRYTAVTMIMPPKQTQSTTSFLNTQLVGGGLGDMAAGGLLKDPNAIYIGLLKSRPVADAIIYQFGLMKVYNAHDMTGARKELKKNTEIVSEKSTLLSISVTDGDKKRAAEMANTYAEKLRELSKTISFTEASRRRIFFEEQLKTQKELLIQAEVAFQQIQQTKGLLRLDTQAGMIIGSLAAMRGQIAAKEIQLQALRSYSTEHNSDVQLVERELATMQAEATQMEQHSQANSYSDMGLKDVPKAGMEYIHAQRELQYQEALYDTLMRQFEAARLDESKEAAVIQVVEPAIPPERKSAPNRLLIVLIITGMGYFIGCLMALIAWRVECMRSDPKAAARLHDLRFALIGQRNTND